MTSETPSKLLVSQLAAQVITDLVLNNQGSIQRKVESLAAQKGLDTDSISTKDIENATDSVVMQDSVPRSKRVWAIAAPVVTAMIYALLSPETLGAFFQWLEQHPSGWGWVAAQVLGVVLVALSKRDDVRQVR